MGEIATIINFDRYIDKFIKNQTEVLKSYEREVGLNLAEERLFQTLRENLDILRYKTDKILGVSEERDIDAL